MNVVKGDIGREPIQPTWQKQKARAQNRTGIVIPMSGIARIRVLKIMLHGEETQYPRRPPATR